MRLIMTSIMLFSIVAVPSITLGADDYTVKGKVTFMYDVSTGVKGTGAQGTGPIPFPKDTQVELWDENEDVVAQTQTTDDAGSYEITINAESTDEFKLCVVIETMKDLANDYERTDISGRFVTALYWNWYVWTENADETLWKVWHHVSRDYGWAFVDKLCVDV